MKRNKLVKFLASGAVFTALIAALTACGGNKNKHSLTLIEGKEATCTTDGYEAYYMCSHCDLIFEDAEGKQETSLAAVKLPALGHDMHKHEADTATCTKPGNVEYYTCSREEGIYYADAEGSRTLDEIGVTVEHKMTRVPQKNPTTEAEGCVEYWECSSCGQRFADSWGDRVLSDDEMRIDKVKENIDGALTKSFYNTQNAYVAGGEDITRGGPGFIVNGKKETDGIYLHIAANYNTAADDQQGDHGKIGLLFNFRNQNDLNLPGSLGVCLEQTIYTELYLSGRVAYHDANTLKYFATVTNAGDAAAKYTTTWELFLSYEDLSKANGGKLAEAFEKKEGKTVLKTGYASMLTVVGNMTYAEADSFNGTNGAKCDSKDNNSWLMWYREGYGDGGADQKYMALGQDGFFVDIPRATDTYAVKKADCQNATVTVPEAVDWDEQITGTVTVNDGYRFTGIKANGKIVVAKDGLINNDYSIDVSSLGLKWYETEIELDFVITKLDYQNVSFTLKGFSGGKADNMAEETAVVLDNGFGDVYNVKAGANGVVSIENVLCQNYGIKVDGYLDGEINVVKGGTLGTVTLEYYFAHNAGDRADLVDLTDMNAENASITLGGQGENGVDQYSIAAQLKLSQEMKSARSYVLYTTVTVNGDIASSKPNTWLQRFAIRFAEGDSGNTYKNKFVVWWDDLGLNSNPSACWVDDTTNCGGGWDRAETYGWLASNILDGLQLKVVRNGGYITISAYNLDDETWYTLLEGATSESAKNDITFFVSGESFTFSEIAFEELQEVGRTLPEGDTAGRLEHLKASNGDLFHISGKIATEESLELTETSVNVTVSAFEKDGVTPVSLENGTEIELTGNYLTYTYTVGGAAITKMLEDEYEAFLYGYGKVKFTVSEGAEVSLKLVKTMAYTTSDKVTVNEENGTVSIVAQDKNGAKNWTGGAEFVIGRDIGTNLAFETTIKMDDVEEGWTGHSTEQRYALQMTESGKGFYFWSWKDGKSKSLVRRLVSLTDCMAEGEIVNGDEEGNGWIYDAIVSEAGLQVRVIRLGGTLILTAVKEGEFVKIGSFECDAADATKIVAYGVTASFEFSENSVKKLTFVEGQEATLESAGNIAYYTDGTHYYLTDGTVTTAEAIVIPRITEHAVEIAVEGYGSDGNKLSDAELSGIKVSLTGEYDYNKNAYTDLSIADGKLSLTDGKIYQGKYSVTVNGYAAEALEIGGDIPAYIMKLYRVSGYQIVEITKTYKPESVTTGFNQNGVTVKLTGCKTDDWAEYNNPVPEATVTLPAGLANGKNVSVEFKLKLSNEGFWGANAFGISMVKGYGGFIFRTLGSDSSETEINELYAQKLAEDNMKLLGKNAWVKGLSKREAGVNVRVVRTGATLALFVQNAERAWIKLYTVSCDANAETEIRLMGAASDFEISDIVVCTAFTALEAANGYEKASEDIVYHGYVAPTMEKDGCRAYYSVGEDIYNESGEKTTLEALKISRLEATEITVTIKGHKDGAETLLNGTVTARGEYETSFTGTLVNGTATVNACFVTYTVSVEGYIAREFTAEEGKTSYEIVLEYDFAKATVEPEKVDLSNMNAANHEIRITGNKGEWDNWAAPVPEAQLVLSETLANSKSVAIEFTLKAENMGHWRAPAFGIAMNGQFNGFMFRFEAPDNMNAMIYQLHGQKLLENYDQLGQFFGEFGFIEQLMLGEGVTLRVVRYNTDITLFAKDAQGEWQRIASVACGADDANDIRFLGNGYDYTVTNISVAPYAAPSVAAVRSERAAVIAVDTDFLQLSFSDRKLKRYNDYIN